MSEPADLGVIVYSYRERGARSVRRWAVATGDRPEDVVSRHGSQAQAERAAVRLRRRVVLVAAPSAGLLAKMADSEKC